MAKRKTAVSSRDGYKTAYVRQAEKFCRLGATDAELADLFRVELATLYQWKAQHLAFCAAVKLGQEHCDERVRRALYASAIGFERDEVDLRVIKGELVATPVRKFYPPNPVSCMFWLRNRDRRNWRSNPPLAEEGEEQTLPQSVTVSVQDARAHAQPE